MRCEFCGVKLFDLGNGHYEDELGLTLCPAREHNEPHQPLLRIVRDD